MCICTILFVLGRRLLLHPLNSFFPVVDATAIDGAADDDDEYFVRVRYPINTVIWNGEKKSSEIYVEREGEKVRDEKNENERGTTTTKIVYCTENPEG